MNSMMGIAGSKKCRLTLALVLIGAAACSASSSASDGDAGDAGLLPYPLNGEGGVPLPGQPGVPLLSSDGGGTCGTTLNAQGCGCSPGAQPRNCYVGVGTQAGIGSCRYGQQTCISAGESGGVWGPCTGSGAPTGSCAAVGAECGTISDGCGGLLDCGTCPAGETCGVGKDPQAQGVGNVCGAGAATCTPVTSCAALGATCGVTADNCGNPLDCGPCPENEACGAAGIPNQCGPVGVVTAPVDAGGPISVQVDGPITYDAGAPVTVGAACTPGQLGAVSGGNVTYCETDDVGTTFPSSTCTPAACLACMQAGCASITFSTPPSTECVTGAQELFNYYAGCGPDRSNVPALLVASCSDSGNVADTIEECKNGCLGSGACSFY